MDGKYRRAEIALLIALCVTLCGGTWARGEQLRLAEKMIRLHIVATSDDIAAQETKIAVRDGILAMLEPVLSGTGAMGEAETIIRGRLSAVEETALSILSDRGDSSAVKVTLEAEYFPTRNYETFSLPTGEYKSLRVIIGEGEGRNWWCVIFPPLCMSIAEGANYVATGLNTDDIALITEGEGYVIKFKTLELWGKISGFFGNKKTEVPTEPRLTKTKEPEISADPKPVTAKEPEPSADAVGDDDETPVGGGVLTGSEGEQLVAVNGSESRVVE